MKFLILWAALSVALLSPRAHGQILDAADKVPIALTNPNSSGVYRIFYGGTSIENFDNAPMRHVLESLKGLYGDSGNQTLSGPAWNGGSEQPLDGWSYQPYGGLNFWRLVGTSSSSPIVLSYYVSQFVVRYSTETPGGTFTVSLDGGAPQSVNCAGPQSYNNEVVINAALGYHTLTITPPATGSAYLEAVDLNKNNPGVSVVDGTLAGSGLFHMFNLIGNPAGTAPGIPIQGNNGLNSYMLCNTPTGKPSLVIFGWVVNDVDSSGALTWINGGYTTAINTLVSETAAAGIPLVLIVEMGGCNCIPTDANYTAMVAARNLLDSFANNPNVTVIDWYGASNPPSTSTDLGTWQTWATYYGYGASITAITPSLVYTGDFVHPTGNGPALAYTLYNEAFGTANDGNLSSNVDIVQQADVNKRQGIATLGSAAASPLFSSEPPGTTVTIVDNTGLEQTLQCIGNASMVATYGLSTVSGGTQPLYTSSTVLNLDPTFNAAIASNPTGSDAYGNYISYSNTQIYEQLPAIVAGKRLTWTFVVGGPCNFGFIPSNQSNTAILQGFVDGVNIGRVAQAGASLVTSTPTTLCYTAQADDANPVISLSGKIYAVYVTATDCPVIPTTAINAARSLGGVLWMSGDLPASELVVGQKYYESINGITIPKIALGQRVWKPGASVYYGLYQAGDLDDCEDLVLDNATISGAYNTQLGGFTVTSTTSPLFLHSADTGRFTAANAGQTYTVSGRSVEADGIVDFGSVSLYDSLTGNTLYYGTTTGLWTLGSAPPAIVNDAGGDPLAVTFTLPTAGQLGSDPWQLRVNVGVVPGTTQFSTWTLSAGSSACLSLSPQTAGSRAPASSSSPGSLGELRFDSGFLYVCVAPNTWKRIALSSF